MSKPTHTGVLKPGNSILPKDWQYKAKLRETKRYWVDRNGVQYSKKTGWPVGVTRPTIVLDINTVVKLT